MVYQYYVPHTDDRWSISAQKFREEGWKATTQHDLISRIESQLGYFDSSFLQSLMGGV